MEPQMNADRHRGPLKNGALIPGKALRRAVPGLVDRFFRGPTDRFKF
jgi:hypothetical protein